MAFLSTLISWTILVLPVAGIDAKVPMSGVASVHKAVQYVDNTCFHAFLSRNQSAPSTPFIEWDEAVVEEEESDEAGGDVAHSRAVAVAIRFQALLSRPASRPNESVQPARTPRVLRC